ncbi:hypothetical protein BDV96DRAFT_584335 [Lophiotrema nucula]|uniref:SET domain-containing protein n=1 Tax=Lophiotrema nucula TaxID=690887 RepID=A0A6A5YSN9_9PLEO|nr:hypothetical protein BDV96DRAFT_584335 [Lophiotrema nucula]
MMHPQLSSVKDKLQQRLSALKELQARLPDEPYSIVLRLELANGYKDLGYPDLAAGDAYKALLLIDEVLQDGEYHEEALSAARNDTNSGRAGRPTADIFLPLSFHSRCTDGPCTSTSLTNDEDKEDEEVKEQTIISATTSWSQCAYHLLVGCLIDCGCLKSASDYNSRALRALPEVHLFKAYKEELRCALSAIPGYNHDDATAIDIQDYPERCLVRRELYPWNPYEPDRFSPESIGFLNNEMASVAPNLEAKISELPALTLERGSVDSVSAEKTRYVKQLGVFAKVDISPGEIVLQEKSMLTAISRLHDSYCDACSIKLPALSASDAPTISCEDCNEAFYCSVECHDTAQALYHPSLCGVTIDRKVWGTEAADYLYSLLLMRALALAETQGVHPLQLKEVRYIWGDYHGLDLSNVWQCDPQGQLKDSFGSIPRKLPFSFQANVLFPLHVLEKMDINIFEQSLRYDTWIFNTLYAKFRGTASARHGLDGRPEIAAVHPVWCLTNHSCDPNVAWEWEGSMKFWTREQLIQWQGRETRIAPGLRAGEEVFSHYCDIRLPVKERREWAIGALGGECMCPRCIWEEADGKGQSDPTA